MHGKRNLFASLLCVVGVVLATLPAHVFANDQLAYVPEDTFLYFGSTKPVPIAKFFKYYTADPDVLAKVMSAEASKSDIDAIEPMMAAYMEFLRAPAAALDKYGIPEDVQLSAYMSGFSPVLRIGLEDTSKFTAAIEALEVEHELSPEVITIGAAKVRRYTAKNNNESAPVKGVISVIGTDAIFTLDLGNEDALSRALGVIKPAQSYQTARTIDKLNEAWGYSGEQAWIWDFENMVTLMTSSEGADGEHLSELLAQADAPPQMVELLRSPECATELAQIAATWPRLVGGYRSFEVNDERMRADLHTAVEVNNPQILTALSKMRGHLPQSTRNGDSIFSMALGLNVSRIGEVLGELGAMLGQLNYTCPALTSLNQAGTQMTSLMMVTGAMGALAQGVKGVSLSLFDAEVDASSANPSVANLDALFSVSADNPQLTLQSIKRIPQLQELQLPDDGSPVTVAPGLTATLGADVDLKAAQKGNQLAFFTGERAEQVANDLAGETLAEGGLLFVGMNMRAFMQRMSGFAIAEARKSGSVANEDDAKLYAEMMTLYPEGRTSYVVDVTDRGLEIDMFMDVKPFENQ